jgi:hypothetical protein
MTTDPVAAVRVADPIAAALPDAGHLWDAEEIEDGAWLVTFTPVRRPGQIDLVRRTEAAGGWSVDYTKG